MSQPKRRCAIYTRKSTEEGLEQAFNSLDAQREACAAYIQSQAGEGWVAVSQHYDDGGFSGGTMDRPALQQLLADIDKGRVDVVVVYKIDRLTRSLMDFAKIVERFDKRNVPFVSVTQAFNTTTSMGRLTLNVLLSFAQFEREVTAERIRDKVSASRKKGIFMGGCPPLGYDAKDRKLIVNESEAETVRWIFNRYVELGSVTALRGELERKEIRTKSWQTVSGKQKGGGPWYIGPLRHILRNRAYVGDAVHKGTAYPGLHEPIIAAELFDTVQRKLDANRTAVERKKVVRNEALLSGLIFDDRGNALSPSRSRKPGGKQYLYYISQARIQRRDPDALRPVPAAMIEDIVCSRVDRLVGRQSARPKDRDATGESQRATLRDFVRNLVSRVEVSTGGATITFAVDALAEHVGVRSNQLHKAVRERLSTNDDALEFDGAQATLRVASSRWSRGGSKRAEHVSSDWATLKTRHDPILIRALVEAHEWRERVEKGEFASIEALASATGRDRKDVRSILKLAFLAPDIQAAILNGRQPASCKLQSLTGADLPVDWRDQRILVPALSAQSSSQTAETT